MFLGAEGDESGPVPDCERRAALPFGEKALNLSEESRKGRAVGWHDRVLDMFVIGETFNLRMMRGVVVAEDHTAAGILPVVAITEPGERPLLDHEGLTDFQEGIVRQAQPDAEVSPRGCEQLYAMPLNLGAWERLNGCADPQEVVLEGTHATARRRSRSVWWRPRYC